MTCMELTVGGFGWVKNLVVPDYYMILPIVLGLLNLSILEV
jgi:inner membrane protein COX18